MTSEDNARKHLESMLRDLSVEPKALPISLLESITNNFSYDQQIGSGGFAVVYKGLLHNGTVAVKKLFNNTADMDENKFIKEADCLTRVKHNNIVRLLGYCADAQGQMLNFEGKMVIVEERRRLLCFEFLPKGSLDKYISDASRGLKWGTRYQIIKGICEGLHYLHQQRIVHLDLKPGNILLDRNMVPKIADFGISKCFDEKQSCHLTSNQCGSWGYIAPESFGGVITLKSDIYSLGIVILEILTGHRGCPVIENVLETWTIRLETSMGDKRLEPIRVCAMIGIKCTDFDPTKRPDTGHIIEMLNQMEHTYGIIVADICASSETETSSSVSKLVDGVQFISDEAPFPLQRITSSVPKELENTSTERSSGGARTAKKQGKKEEAKRGSGAEAESSSGDVGGMLENLVKTLMAIREKLSNNKIDINMMAWKIHSYPASIRVLSLSEWYTAPVVVSIGPYHHGREHLKKAEMVKHVAAYNCIRNSGHSVEEMYVEVVQAAHCARSLYDNDVVAGISDDDFIPMMFFDACFLVQYMLIMSYTDDSVEDDDASLCSFFDSNDLEIYHDIMLLENQLPWPVVQAVMKFVKVPLDRVIDCLKGCLQDHKDKLVGKTYIGNDPPHLLGLLRFYIVGENRTQPDTKFEISSVPFSVSAVELVGMGVTLKPSETTEISHMGLKTTGTFSAELSLAPLSLDSARASWLINMAAHELCTTSNFRGAKDEDSAVCSYLLLLAMLVDREEDVHELRTKGLLRGGRGLSNSEALDFFRSVQSLRPGSCFVRTMNEIEIYRSKRRTRITVHAFFHKNMKIIAAVLFLPATVVAVVGILGALILLWKL